MKLLCRVNTCCCGASLRTGSLLIGILEAIGIGIFIVFCAVFVLVMDSFPPGDLKHNEEVLLSSADRAIMKDLSISSAIINGVLLACNLIMIYGIVKFRHAMFIPWFVFEFLIIFCNIILSTWLLAVAFRISNTLNVVVHLVYLTVFTSLRWYFITVVYSYYMTLKERYAT